MLELIERDVYAGRYGIPGRPNLLAVQSVFSESASVLERFRDSALELLRVARAERRQ